MKFDAIVIGSGPGGYVCAIRMAQLGMKTAIIEKYNALGGTCLNVGCIPSKALLDSSEHFHNASHNFSEHGIKISGLEADLAQMIKRKSAVVSATVSGVEYLMKKNKIEVFYGHASFKNDNTVNVDLNDGKKQELSADHIVIATGSKPVVPAAFNYDKKRVITSTEALEIKKLPKKMVIVGGGVIGLELGSVFARLGTEITVIEYQDRLTPTMDKDCSRELKKVLKKLGMTFYLKHKVDSVKANRLGTTVSVSPVGEGESMHIKADYCLVAIGRRPYTDKLGLENTSIEVDERGRISVDEHLQTKAKGVYAIGDVIKGAMLAHKAEEEGVFVAEWINGQKPHLNYNLIPGVVYTWPEVASVGQTEEELKAEGIKYKSGKFAYKGMGRARASMDTDGFVKILADAETDEILGVHMVGARVADLIMEAASVMEFRGSAEDVARMCHPHPTYSEVMKEAALAVDNRALHS